MSRPTGASSLDGKTRRLSQIFDYSERHTSGAAKYLLVGAGLPNQGETPRAVRLSHRMRAKGAPADATIAEVAARQHGVVTTAQLAAVGTYHSGITRRLESGRLHRIHRGVYAVGHRGLSTEGRWLAAVLACGDGAVLSYRSAAASWGLLPVPMGPVDVTVGGSGGRRRRPGIRRHRARSLKTADVTRRAEIPVTTPARTIADLRRVSSPAQLRRAIREAAVLGLALDTTVDAEPTRSELEYRFLRLCRRHRLPMPAVNAQVDRFIVDFLWRERDLIVETDGFRYHRGRQAFEDDRARDAELRLLGYEIVRFSYRQVVDDPLQVAATVRLLLRGAPFSPYAGGKRTSA
jgi:very-short-patch-repair endonuclease